MLHSTLQPMPGCVVATSLPQPPQAWRASPADAVFGRFVDLMYRRRQVRAAFESCVVREGFIDHAGFSSRAAAMTSLAASLGSEGARVEVLHSVCDGDIGMVHLAVHSPPNPAPSARVEIFRLAEGRIVEHWSVAA